jgi:transposase
LIPVSLFDTISHWRGQQMPIREIARRLGIDVKTVRRNLRKQAGGATAPSRSAPASKLEPYHQRVAELFEAGRTAWSIYAELAEDQGFPSSYEIVKRYVRALRKQHPKVYERLEHPAGAEIQVDFGELARVEIDGRMVRTWALVGIWPHSRYRFSVVVTDQTVPAFLAAIQDGLRACESIPERLTLDNLSSGVVRDQLCLRAYQRDFAAFCAHYGMMPNAVRPRTPTDKGMVENGVKALKTGLKGRSFSSLDALRDAVAARTNALNERIHSVTQRRPVDIFTNERRGKMPEVYPIAMWAEAKVRRDCHVQAQYNYYSVPHVFVGKTVVLRMDAEYISIFNDFQEIAQHRRACGRGVTTTDRSHYPEAKRATWEERRAERLLRIRAVGPGVAAFWHGIHASREYVHSDHVQALLRLIDAGNHAELDRACARAAHFGNFSIPALKRIIDGRLFELPFDDLPVSLPPMPASTIALARPLEAYAELIGAR